jgi:hypothetical protein
VVHLLGRRIPPDFEHVARYALSAAELPIPPAGTEKSLGLPWWWKQHIQDRNSCVGFGESAERSITNHYQRLRETGRDLTYRYNADWLYDEALKVDEWPGEADEGTSLRAGYSVLVMQGHRRVQRGVSGLPTYEHGVTTYRWAESVDDVRSAIYAGLAIAIGTNWYSKMDDPIAMGNEWFLPTGSLGAILGGHCTCLFRMSDRREAFGLMNSWRDYPWVWLPYALLERLLSELGEAGVVTDR